MAFGGVSNNESGSPMCRRKPLLMIYAFRYFYSGVGKYDKIGIISNNRWEWAALACAAYSMTASIVPMYEAQVCMIMVMNR